MSSSLPPTPISPTAPSVGARRKGPRVLPTLPLSAFTPPSTGVGEQFPLPPDPNTIHPNSVIDAHVITPSGNLSNWHAEIDEALKGRLGGAVLSLHGATPGEVESVISKASASETPILALLVPFSLDEGAPTDPPAYLANPGQKPQIVLSSTFTTNTPAAAEALKWALDKGFSIDIDVQSNLKDNDSEWEALEDLFAKAMPHESDSSVPRPKGKVILSNILPPPDDLHLPIVKLLTHPTYQAYQSHCAALSLYSNVFVKFIPPSWGSPTPPTPAPTAQMAISPVDSPIDPRDTQDKKEWKRRIKMYIGPSLEAFGYARIIYGSSPSPFTRTKSNAADWYELARESFAELGTEQEGVDAVFYGNAQLVYGSASS
ncbi:hypothetical protein EIP91_009272 [Steccherinum ochraceum]|uniref:Amidohydrolase-related domain-containing protein n=1 Tax=Steccherinum ochraceum TaxID=92696 RepID=A0A4R0RBJ4_9APHY|nr:hypothetical protein EIP91_009272 [Steccherinum ochraceum]